MSISSLSFKEVHQPNKILVWLYVPFMHNTQALVFYLPTTIHNLISWCAFLTFTIMHNSFEKYNFSSVPNNIRKFYQREKFDKQTGTNLR